MRSAWQSKSPGSNSVHVSYSINKLVAINENFQSIEAKSHGTEGFPIQQAFYKDPDIYQREFYLVQFYDEPKAKLIYRPYIGGNRPFRR